MSCKKAAKFLEVFSRRELERHIDSWEEQGRESACKRRLSVHAIVLCENVDRSNKTVDTKTAKAMTRVLGRIADVSLER